MLFRSPLAGCGRLWLVLAGTGPILDGSGWFWLVLAALAGSYRLLLAKVVSGRISLVQAFSPGSGPALAGSYWLWQVFFLVLAVFGWQWLPLVGSGWHWLALAVSW